MHGASVKPQILLVDDEPGIVTLLAEVLRRNGYGVITARDGCEATALYRQQEQQPVDLLLTDIAMPQKNGIELARELRALWPALPVIFMSGNYNLWQDQIGFFPCLQKPFTPEVLIREVARKLNQARHGWG